MNTNQSPAPLARLTLLVVAFWAIDGLLVAVEAKGQDITNTVGSVVIGEEPYVLMSENSPADGKFSLAFIKKSSIGSQTGKQERVFTYTQRLHKVHGYDVSPSGQSLFLLLAKPLLGSRDSVYLLLFFRLGVETNSIFKCQQEAIDVTGTTRTRVDFIEINTILRSKMAHDVIAQSAKLVATKPSQLSNVKAFYVSTNSVEVTGLKSGRGPFVIKFDVNDDAERVTLKSIEFKEQPEVSPASVVPATRTD